MNEIEKLNDRMDILEERLNEVTNPILYALEDYDVYFISGTTGHVFNFEYKGHMVNLTNQDSRIVGNYHYITSDPAFSEVIKNIRILDKYEGNFRAKKYGYKRFCIEGLPSKSIPILMKELECRYTL